MEIIKRPWTNILTQKKNLNIYFWTIHAPFVLCGSFQLIVVVRAIMSEALLKFPLKRIYGLKEDVVWRRPRWLFSAWPNLMCKWGDFCYFWVSKLPEAFHQFSAQKYIWFGRRCRLINSKMAVYCMAIFDVSMGWYYLFLSLHIDRSLPSSF